jgi:hypothetical protein
MGVLIDEYGTYYREIGDYQKSLKTHLNAMEIY